MYNIIEAVEQLRGSAGRRQIPKARCRGFYKEVFGYVWELDGVAGRMLRRYT
jgi:hypothetical protein